MKNIFTEKKSGNDNRANRKQIQRGKQVIESWSFANAPSHDHCKTRKKFVSTIVITLQRNKKFGRIETTFWSNLVTPFNKTYNLNIWIIHSPVHFTYD